VSDTAPDGESRPALSTSIMATYEIRFLGAGGETLLVYVTSSDDVPDIVSTLAVGDGLPYTHYELWRGSRRLFTGVRESASQEPGLVL
jgi:hypothetical protein